MLLECFTLDATEDGLQIVVKVRTRFGTLKNYLSNAPMTYNSWNQIVLVFNGSALELFVNCTPVLQANNPDPDFPYD
ncbi:unnamed protein product [Gongylonema pulchrum]|uniref:DUF667 domain-containing protein n=1 Tax=Gongylonema pulchrum TaxID=637853 RepID=A0A183D9Q1_9BILA|nr:unnamed protein product [Gongylonema pulchrum]